MKSYVLRFRVTGYNPQKISLSRWRERVWVRVGVGMSEVYSLTF